MEHSFKCNFRLPGRDGESTFQNEQEAAQITWRLWFEGPPGTEPGSVVGLIVSSAYSVSTVQCEHRSGVSYINSV